MDEVRASYTDVFAHSFDAKGRITVPSEWREAPFEKTLYIFPSKENEKCVKVYPASWLGDLQREVSKLKAADPQRKGVEDLAMRAQTASFDGQGRIMVKEKLREGAGLGKDVVLVGRLDHFLIWDKAKFEERSVAGLTVEDVLEGIGR
jgi:MraZ protein